MPEKVDPAKLIEIFKSKWVGESPCPICRSIAWNVSEFLVEAPSFSSKGIELGGPRIPMAAVTCTNCGHTHFFNAIILGLVEPPVPEPKVTERQTAQTS
jgi:hypothetical protein